MPFIGENKAPGSSQVPESNPFHPHANPHESVSRPTDPSNRPDPFHHNNPPHELPVPPESPKKESLFLDSSGKQRSVVSMREIERKLEGKGRDIRVRKEIAKKFGITDLWSERMNKIVEEIKEEIHAADKDKRPGISIYDIEEGMFDKRHHGLEPYQKERREIAQMGEGGYTGEERKEIKTRKTIWKILGGLFGSGEKE